MSKRQAILLLGVFMANLWGSVVYAPAVGARRPVRMPADVELSSSRSLSDVGSEDDLGSIGRQGAMYAGPLTSGADEAVYGWVKDDASDIAKYLYNEGVTMVSYDAIADVYEKLRGKSLTAQPFVDEDTKLYMQGAIQAFVDNMTSRIVADQRGVDAWLHQHAAKLVAYFESKKVTSIGNYAAILRACKDLGITPLAAKKEKVKQRLLASLNNRLEDETGLLPADDIHLHAILAKLLAEHAHDVNKRQLLKTARALKLPKDVIARIDAMPEAHMQRLLKELNQELDTPTVQEDPRIVVRALSVLAQAGQQQQDNVAFVLDVIRAAVQGEEEQSIKRARTEDRHVVKLVEVFQAAGNSEDIR